MIHHVSVGSNDIARSRRFYEAVLPIVGLALTKASERALDFGGPDIPYLFSIETPLDGRPAVPANGGHIAFTAQDRATVDRFFRAALEHGGRDAGPPGLRPEYDAHYYGAFVLDPDGNKIEAVTFAAT